MMFFFDNRVYLYFCPYIISFINNKVYDIVVNNDIISTEIETNIKQAKFEEKLSLLISRESIDLTFALLKNNRENLWTVIVKSDSNPKSFSLHFKCFLPIMSKVITIVEKRFKFHKDGEGDKLENFISAREILPYGLLDVITVNVPQNYSIFSCIKPYNRFSFLFYDLVYIIYSATGFSLASILSHFINSRLSIQKGHKIEKTAVQLDLFLYKLGQELFPSLLLNTPYFREIQDKYEMLNIRNIPNSSDVEANFNISKVYLGDLRRITNNKTLADFILKKLTSNITPQGIHYQGL
ncbi:MAG: hypothetical protein ACTSVW_02715 [Candidatus Njordarchaeales archaeon]